MDCQKIIELIEKYKIIVIMRGLDKDQALKTVNALCEGGIRLCEITFSATNHPSASETGDIISSLVKTFGDKMHIGAGTVLTENQLETAWKSGAEFIISPDTNPTIIKKTKELGLVSIPGAFTPTEIMKATESGADFIKLFPSDNMSPSYVKSVSAPFSSVRFLAVGGVNENNLSSYHKAGAVGFGIGSGIIKKDLIEKNDYESVKHLAEIYVKQISLLSENKV